ncbi:MAG: hypothetical protein J5685_12575 [Clostridiales bacterium]|nr:hypothetical protein [Clostridiales bacterium]
MFADLVHIELIRITRSRFFLIGLLFLAVLFVYVNLVYPMTIYGALEKRDFIVEAEPLGDNPYGMQVIMYTLNTSLVSLFCMINTVFSTCDYYKYREFINIRGNVRSRSKICIADMTGLLIQALCLSILPLIATVFASNYDSASILRDYPFAAALMYLTFAWSVFNSSILIYAVAKLFRRKTLTILTIPVIWFGAVSLIRWVVYTMRDIIRTDYTEVVAAILYPTTYISDAMLGDGSFFGAAAAFVLAVVQTVLFGTLAVLFSRRCENI